MKRVITTIAKRILPNSIRKSIFHFGFDIARDEFEKFSYDFAYAPNMHHGLTAVSKRGFEPKTVLDIGAFEGDWSSMAHALWPHAKIMMIEGNEGKRAKLDPIATGIGAELIFSLLGAENGRSVEFYEMESGSSVFEEESTYERQKVERRLSSLDALLPEGRSFDFIKIDTQGYELEVLKGGERCLASAEAVLLEVSLIEINNGAPLIAEVIEFMRDRDFVVYDILEIHRRQLDAATNQVDILFVRENSNLRASRSFT